MNNTKKGVVKIFILFLMFSQTSRGESEKEYINNILDYENKFLNAQVFYQLDDVTRNSDGTMISNMTDGVPYDIIYSSSEKMRRLDRSKIDSEDIERIISDQEKIMTYKMSERTVSVDPFGSKNENTFPIMSLMPFTHYGGDRAEKVNINEQNNEIVVEWEQPDADTVRAHVVYEKDGDLLRPISFYKTYMATPQSPRQKSLEITYEYDSNGNLKRILSDIVAHNFTLVMNVKEIKFNPTFESEYFSMKIPRGTYVVDNTLGGGFSYKYQDDSDLLDHIDLENESAFLEQIRKAKTPEGEYEDNLEEINLDDRQERLDVFAQRIIGDSSEGGDNKLFLWIYIIIGAIVVSIVYRIIRRKMG